MHFLGQSGLFVCVTFRCCYSAGGGRALSVRDGLRPDFVSVTVGSSCNSCLAATSCSVHRHRPRFTAATTCSTPDGYRA